MPVGDHQQGAANIHAAEKSKILERARNASAGDLVWSMRGDFTASKRDGAGRRRIHAGDAIEERRLARAIGADHRCDGAGLRAE